MSIKAINRPRLGPVGIPYAATIGPLVPRDALIGTVMEMIDHTLTCEEELSPLELAEKIVDEVLTVAKIPLDDFEDIAA